MGEKHTNIIRLLLTLIKWKNQPFISKLLFRVNLSGELVWTWYFGFVFFFCLIKLMSKFILLQRMKRSTNRKKELKRQVDTDVCFSVSFYNFRALYRNRKLWEESVVSFWAIFNREKKNLIAQTQNLMFFGIYGWRWHHFGNLSHKKKKKHEETWKHWLNERIGFTGRQCFFAVKPHQLCSRGKKYEKVINWNWISQQWKHRTEQSVA